MGFLAPWFLLLAAAAAVPLLIHLLRRRIGTQVEFPAARYLARAEREHSRTLRMRNLLLMLLRVAAILLLAAAAARPAARLFGSAVGHAPAALAIVLDNSMSTSVIENGGPLIDALVGTARDALRAASAEDRLWLVTSDGAVRGGSATTLLEDLERIKPLAGAGNIRDALANAVAAVQSAGLQGAENQVALLTDGQQTAWNDPVAVPPEVHVLLWSPDEAPAVNRAVILAEARPERWTPRGTVAVRVQSPDSTTYRMRLGERTLARGTAAPGEDAIIRAAPAERGWTNGTVEIEPDELTADNLRHFALWIGAAPVVSVSNGAGPFVRNAVEVLRGSDRVRTAGSPSIAIASADEAASLPALLLPPENPVRAGAANRALERLGVPWRFGARHVESTIARGAQIPGVAVSDRYELLPRGVSRADTLAAVGREPWIVSGEGYVLVGSLMQPSATSLPVSASFLPWLGDVIASRLHAEPGTVRAALPGERVIRPAMADALESTEGGRIALDPGSAAFDAPATAGTWFFVRGDRRVGALVVNPEPAESRLDRWRPAALRTHAVSSKGNARQATTPAEWVRLAFGAAARRSLVGPLLLAALLLLGVEAFVARAGRAQA